MRTPNVAMKNPINVWIMHRCYLEVHCGLNQDLCS